MLRVVLDEHISPAIGVATRRSCRTFRAISIHDLEDSQLLGLPDRDLLVVLAHQHLTLVTFDLKTIPKLLRSWAEQNIPHGGVIFIDEKTFAQNDIGGVARALCRLYHSHGKLDWTNRTFFLQQARD